MDLVAVTLSAAAGVWGKYFKEGSSHKNTDLVQAIGAGIAV